MPAHAAAALLIIAPGAFAPALEEFIAFKGERIASEFVALETALGSARGCDDAERLKRYLYERWRADGIRYALLVGDAGVLPLRYMSLDRSTAPAFNYAFYPSDLYYGDLAKRDGSFESWNAATIGFHEGYFGEVRGETNKFDPINYDCIDYRPEIAIGRWPVRTTDEAAALAHKSMRHERAVEARAHDTASMPEAQRAKPLAGLVMVGGWIDARPMFERLRTRLEPSWKVDRRYFGGADYGVEEPSEAQVVALVGSGASLILHAGHGNDDRWEGCLSVASIPAMVKADALPIVMSAGCSTARCATLPPYEPYEDVLGVRHAGTNAGEVFTAPPPPPSCYAKGEFDRTGLGEELVRDPSRGAIAYIGCNTGSQPCALTLVEGFVDAVATLPSPRLGDCWTHAIDFYWRKEGLDSIVPTQSWYPASIYFQGMKFMLYGDPSLGIE